MAIGRTIKVGCGILSVVRRGVPAAELRRRGARVVHHWCTRPAGRCRVSFALPSGPGDAYVPAGYEVSASGGLLRCGGKDRM